MCFIREKIIWIKIFTYFKFFFSFSKWEHILGTIVRHYLEKERHWKTKSWMAHLHQILLLGTQWKGVNECMRERKWRRIEKNPLNQLSTTQSKLLRLKQHAQSLHRSISCILCIYNGFQDSTFMGLLCVKASRFLILCLLLGFFSSVGLFCPISTF